MAKGTRARKFYSTDSVAFLAVLKSSRTGGFNYNENAIKLFLVTWFYKLKKSFQTDDEISVFKYQVFLHLNLSIVAKIENIQNLAS